MTWGELILFGLLLPVAIAAAITQYIKWSVKREMGECKSVALARISEEFEKTGDVDKFCIEFEKLFYPNGYFEL